MASSSTFEKSHRLRTFFLHVCQCALEDRPEAATEQQIGIHVFGRPPGYNPNEDNIVRSQARLLRLKLEHHFANEGKDEPLTISIPKGQYLPVFEGRITNPVVVAPPVEPKSKPGSPWLALALSALGVVVLGTAVWLGSRWLRPQPPEPGAPASAAGALQGDRSQPGRAAPPLPAGAAPGEGEVRIAAGNTGAAFVDRWGRRWEPDRYYHGGLAQAGPKALFPPAPNPGLFRTMRESVSSGGEAPPFEREFRYDIPVRPGVYELRLYFADPMRGSEPEKSGDGQNTRHFLVNVNGRSLLWNFDPTTDADPASTDIRVFKDITPAEDGLVHLEFMTCPERPFVNALELVPGTPGKLKPIRLTAHESDFVDPDGVRWSGDNYYIHGRIATYANPGDAGRLPPLYTHERYGNFSYAIPVAPGSYTVKLHFAESFFTPTNPAAFCRGAGCRVFDVTCNGVNLVRNLDVYEAAGGPFRPLVRTFHGLEPNGQGKLLLSFSPRVNYAEVRAIEVIDEAK